MSLEETVQFIQGKGKDLEHTLPEIQEFLLGKVPTSRDDASDYHRTYSLARKAREKIEKEMGGTWVEETRPDGVKVYRFQKAD